MHSLHLLPSRSVSPFLKQLLHLGGTVGHHRMYRVHLRDRVPETSAPWPQFLPASTYPITLCPNYPFCPIPIRPNPFSPSPPIQWLRSPSTAATVPSIFQIRHLFPPKSFLSRQIATIPCPSPNASPYLFPSPQTRHPVPSSTKSVVAIRSWAPISCKPIALPC